MQRLLVSSLLLLVVHIVRCQDSVSMASLIPDKVIKYSPLHLLNFYPSFQISYEHAIGKNWTAQADAGYVFNYANLSSEFMNKRGVKLRLEPRLYFGPNFDKKKIFYSALELYLNRVNFDREQTREECFDLSCDNRFTRRYEFVVAYREFGSSLKIGKVKWYGRFLMDYQIGWTVRFINYDHPPGLEPEQVWLPLVREEDRIGVRPCVNVRAGYRLK